MDPVDIQDIQADERQAVSVTINSRVEVKKLRGFSIATAYAKDYTGTIKLTWFNCPFLRNYFHIGDRYIFVGEVKYKNGMYTMSQPEYYTVPKYQEIFKRMAAGIWLYGGDYKQDDPESGKGNASSDSDAFRLYTGEHSG